MAATKLLLMILYIATISAPSYAVLEGYYCEEDNCYELLGVQNDVSKSDLTKAYRKLARQWHPDTKKGKAEKEAAAEMFKKIANAYEILKDEETRKDYDYLLDNPDEYYSHMYRYYKRRVTPKVDPKIVIAVTITIISIIQYWSGWTNYNTAISYLVTVPKYRLQAQDIARSEGLLGDKRKKDRSKTKEEIKEEEEAILKKVIEERMDIRGSYSKPTLYDVLWVQLALLPVHTYRYAVWYARWLWKFTLLRHEYGDEEREYIVRRNMRLSQGQWDALEEHEKEDFMRQQLWIEDNFKEWKRIKEEEKKAELATNARYKSYRRYMKKGGPGQMQFGPE